MAGQQTYTGQVKWFNEQKGFGMIASTDGGRDIFVHHTKIESQGHGRRTLNENDEVEYQFEITQKGPAATWVRPLQSQGGYGGGQGGYGGGQGGGYGGGQQGYY